MLLLRCILIWLNKLIPEVKAQQGKQRAGLLELPPRWSLVPTGSGSDLPLLLLGRDWAKLCLFHHSTTQLKVVIQSFNPGMAARQLYFKFTPYSILPVLNPNCCCPQTPGDLARGAQGEWYCWQWGRSETSASCLWKENKFVLLC